MTLEQDEDFRKQRRLYTLRFNCEHCAYFDPEPARCVHGYPCARHRDAWYDDPSAPLHFCKEFELA